MMRRFWNARHTLPLFVLVILNIVYWSKVVASGGVYLPGRMLTGFAPFGSDASAPWNILQWDALGQYYPWRHFAGQMLGHGTVPLWNPFQFAGTPFVANLQSAVFYPLNLPFWIFNTTYAFAITAILHMFLVTFSTYFLAQRWQMSRPASLLAAVGFGFCGYIAAWFTLPTLANTACWLPLLILLLEWTSEKRTPDVNGRVTPFHHSSLKLAVLSVALACAVLAGHVQIFLYIVTALILRTLFLTKPFRALGFLLLAGIWSFGLAALQILPTLELATLGHRSGGAGTVEAWNRFIVPRALQWSELPSLFVPRWPTFSFNENFGYLGVVVCGLALIGIAVAIKQRSRQSAFVATLAIFGLLYALATPLAEAFFLYVPGVAQMGGPGRALLLWSFGAAMLAAFSLDWFIKREQGKSTFAGVNKSTFTVTTIALVITLGELYGNAHLIQPIAPAATIYPKTQLTDWLQENVAETDRIIFITPRNSWLPSEVLQQSNRTHPPGVLPPNGATVYGLHDASGYDSLSSKAYRDFLVQGEDADVSPPLNGNMILINNPQSSVLDALRVRFVISESEFPLDLDAPKMTKVWEGENCVVYQRAVNIDIPRRDGKDFYPGWKNDIYQPTTFRLGLFMSLCAWFAVMMTVGFCGSNRET